MKKAFKLNGHDQPAAFIENAFELKTDRGIVDKATGLAAIRICLPHVMV